MVLDGSGQLLDQFQAAVAGSPVPALQPHGPPARGLLAGPVCYFIQRAQEAIRTQARKLRASLPYRVATRRHYLILP